MDKHNEVREIKGSHPGSLMFRGKSQWKMLLAVSKADLAWNTLYAHKIHRSCTVCLSNYREKKRDEEVLLTRKKMGVISPGFVVSRTKKSKANQIKFYINKILLYIKILRDNNDMAYLMDSF